MTSKKKPKKSVADKSLMGKTAVEKGRRFEDMVTDLYRLLGAEVIRNIMICHKKVDILATFQLPGSSALGHRVIVECKDEKKTINQNQRVMQFKGLLETARKVGEADSAEIITRVPWSDQAKGFAHQSGILLLTYQEKISRLIDFSIYLKNLVQKYEKGDPHNTAYPPLGKYFVDLKAERKVRTKTEEIPNISRYVNTWLESKGKNLHLAILGEYGMGKSSLCQKIAYDLAVSYLRRPGSTRIPIFFNLRDFTKTLSIESLVTSFLDENCGVINPRYRLFRAMNDAGILLILFDGFDEMATRVDIDAIEVNLQEIEKLALQPNSKVIITSRIEYFVSRDEEKKSLRPKGELLASRQVEYETLRILPWEDEQVNSFLRKRIPLVKEATRTWNYYRDRIRKIPGLSDLSRRPVLLEMIVKTLPQLIQTGKTINLPNLYEMYLLGELKRQKIMKRRKLILSEGVRLSLLQHLAIDFYNREMASINFSEASRYIEKYVNPARPEVEAYTRDLLTSSFLIREGNEYQFSHRSIMEYLCAKFLINEINHNQSDTFKKQPLEPVVIEFYLN